MKYLLIVGGEANIWPASTNLESIVNDLERVGAPYSCEPLTEPEDLAS